MKKRIKDLTLEETVALCEERGKCCDCPLTLYADVCLQDFIREGILEQEIEVDLSEKEN